MTFDMFDSSTWSTSTWTSSRQCPPGTAPSSRSTVIVMSSAVGVSHIVPVYKGNNMLQSGPGWLQANQPQEDAAQEELLLHHHRREEDRPGHQGKVVLNCPRIWDDVQQLRLHLHGWAIRPEKGEAVLSCPELQTGDVHRHCLHLPGEVLWADWPPQATRGLNLEGHRAETKKLKKKYCEYDLFVSIFSVYLGNSSIISADIILLWWFFFIFTTKAVSLPRYS